jgi:hypothetical protein
MSEIHVNGIAITLAHLDEVISNLELWAKGREIHSVLYHERNDLSEEQRALILEDIAEIRRILEETQSHLNLASRVNDGAREIVGECSILWVNLVGLEGKYLKRYGDPPADLVAYIEPVSKELIHRVSRIGNIANGKAPVAATLSAKNAK